MRASAVTSVLLPYLSPLYVLCLFSGITPQTVCLESTSYNVSSLPSTPIPSDPRPASPSPALLHDVYASVFRLRDGSTLASIDSTAAEAMRGSVSRILSAQGESEDLLSLARSLPDDRLLALLLLAVAGNFTVDQSPSALPQRCGIVVDPGTGALVLRDNAVAQSVVLEVLLIVSIVCLLGAWGSPRESNLSK